MLKTWTATHTSGLTCRNISLREVLQRLWHAEPDDVLQIDAGTVVVGSWTFTRGGV